MTLANKNIIDSYAGLFEGLDVPTKRKLIERLAKSVESVNLSKEKAFYNTFGAFPDSRSAESISEDLKSSRKFRSKDLEF